MSFDVWGDPERGVWFPPWTRPFVRAEGEPELSYAHDPSCKEAKSLWPGAASVSRITPGSLPSLMPLARTRRGGTGSSQGPRGRLWISNRDAR